MNPLVAVLPGSSYGLWAFVSEGQGWRLTCLACGADLHVTPTSGAVLEPTLSHESGCPMPALAAASKRGRQRRALRACLAAAAARRAPQPETVQ